MYIRGSATVGIGMLCAVLACCLLVSLICRPHCRPYENGPFAHVTWKESGTPYVLNCTVVDSDGAPLAGARVNVHNNSGGNAGLTDQTGAAAIELFENEIDRLEINRIVVLDRPHASFTGVPDVSRGLTMRIVIKDRLAFERQ